MNGFDDNFNGVVDCADPECSSEPYCGPERFSLFLCEQNVCSDGIDNDGDNDTDIDDLHCRIPDNNTQGISQLASISGTGAPPTVEYGWILPDEDDMTSGTQTNPSLGAERNDIHACVVVSDPQGRDDIQNVYVDVFHPAGTGGILPCVVEDGDVCDESGQGQPWEKTGDLFKYQVHAVRLDPNRDRREIEACKADALAAGLISQDDFDEINYQIFSQPNWYMYRVYLPMLYHQPAGIYTALAWATDTSSAVSNENETMYFEWISTVSLGLDFASLDYGQLQPSVYKVIQGDYMMYYGDGTPTLKNEGNERVYLSVRSENLTGIIHGKEIDDFDVKWDPEEIGYGYGQRYFKGGDFVFLDDPLELCQTEKIDFSVHADIGLPEDTYTGIMTLTAGRLVD